MWQAILAGLSLGLLSSFHCVGMCGPLALAMPVYHLPVYKQRIAVILYNLGRLITYSTLGLLFGLAGRSMYIAGYQQWFSIALGVLILLLAAQYFFLHKAFQPKWLQRFHNVIQSLMSRYLRSPRITSYLFLGMVNGLLPCGMVYLAIAGALSTSQVSTGIVFMFFFGTGTLPLMLTLGLLGARFPMSFRQQLKKLMPAVITGMAVLLILRGLNLGIPFISPVLPVSPGQTISCH